MKVDDGESFVRRGKGPVMVRCPNGHENLENEHFCGECGVAIAPAVVICAYCGHPNLDDHHFCGECGAPLLVTGSVIKSGQSTTGHPSGDEAETGKAHALVASAIDDYAPEPSPNPPPANQRSRSTTTAARLNPAPSYMPNLIAALVASLGVFVGSLGPWANFLAFTANGADINLKSGWGGTLTLGALSAVALFTQLNWGRSGSSPWWLVPLVCAVPLCGLVSLILAVVLIVRMRSLPAADFFGTSLAVQVGWGLWMVGAASAVLCITGWVVADKMVGAIEAVGSTTRAAWSRFCRIATIIGAVAIVAFAVSAWHDLTKPEGDSGLNLAPETASPSPTGVPSLPSSPSFPSMSAPSFPTSAPTTPSQTSGHHKTIQDYLRQNGIIETAVHRGDPGSPNFDLPFPPDWSDAGAQTPNWAYGAIVYNQAEVPSDPPSIIALVSKLTGYVDPAKILELAPGELKNLPQYEPLSDDTKSTLSGFDAVQLGGTYVKDGKKRIIAQKTVVIPGRDGGLYVLQMNADALDGQENVLMDATNVIDMRTIITP